MENLINNVYFIIFMGWFTFNAFKFSMAKDLRDESDQKFPIFPYVGKNWDNWLVSACVAFILLVVGQKKFDVSPLGVEWNDLYYFMPGPATEWLTDRYKIWQKKRNQNQTP